MFVKQAFVALRFSKEAVVMDALVKEAFIDNCRVLVMFVKHAFVALRFTKEAVVIDALVKEAFVDN